MNKNIIAGVVIVILAAGAAYFTVTHKLPVAQVSPSPSPIASATPSAMANWKTYTNSQYAFQVNYPASSTPNLYLAGDTTHIEFMSEAKVGYLVTVESTNGFPIDHGDCFNAIQTKEVNSINWLINQYTCKDASGPDWTFAAFTTKNANEYGVFSKASTRAELDQILSTFKFTNTTVGWKDFSSKYFTLSFKAPSFAQVVDTQNSIIVAKAPYIPLDGSPAADNAFVSLVRYVSSQTQANMVAKLRNNNKATVSSMVIDGQSFPRVDYTEPVSGARFFTVFFEKSYVSVTLPSINTDSSIDYIGIGQQILTTFTFKK